VSELVILLAADTDIQSAFSFYEGVQPGRGKVFLQHLEGALGQLRRFPDSGPVVHARYRRLLVPSFPFGVFYIVEGSRIIVVGVMSLHREPESIRQRFLT
jgi:toxin ParE1/3/4